MVKNKLINFIKKYWHIFFLVCLSLIPLVWFFGKGGAIINGVDTNFPLDPAMWLYRRFYMWNNISNGGSDFSFAPAGIFFHLVQFIPYVIGLSLQSVEKISLIFWFGLIVVNSYIFSANFIKTKLLRVLFVVLYSLNIYMFNTWENVKVANLSLVAAIPLLLHVYINLKDKLITKSKTALLLILTSLILSGSGINPAYFITAIISLVIFALASFINGDSLKSVFKPFIFIVCIILIVSAYWILPTINFVLQNVSQSASIGSIGFNNWIDSLSVNTSIINILRFQGAWDWYSFDAVTSVPLYLPYVLNYFNRTTFIFFSFVISAISLISLVFRSKNKHTFYISYLIMLLVGVFLGAGSHEPTGIFFKWLAEHIPYFSLFRSPWYIFTPLLTISTAGLITLFFDTFKPNKILNIGIAFFALANIIYCYPLATGRIFRPSKPDGFFVNFPNYIFEVGNKLSSMTENRTISYPDDQLEKFNWGYIGVEPVINLFSNSEMVFSGINNTESSFSKIVSLMYQKLKQGHFVSFYNIASKTNVDLILEKYDQKTLSPKLPNNLGKITKNDEWLVHNLKTADNAKIKLVNKFYLTDFESVDTANQFGVISPTEHTVNSNDSVINDINDIQDHAGKIVSTVNSQNKNYLYSEENKNKKIDLTNVNFEFSVYESGLYSPVLEIDDLRDVDLDNFVIFDGQKYVTWILKKKDDSYAYFDNIFLEKGRHTYSYSVKNNLIFQDSLGEEGGIRKLENYEDEDINFDVALKNFDFNKLYYVSFDYMWNRGGGPLAVLNQVNEQTLFKSEKIGLDRELEVSNFGFYFTPVQTISSVGISFVAQKTASNKGTLVNYGNLKVYELFTNNLFLIKDSSKIGDVGDLQFNFVSPIKYSGTVKSINNPQFLAFLDNYSDGWKIKITDLDGNKIKYRADHFTIDSYANAWYIDTLNKDFRFEIYYDPQKYFDLGLFISTISILAILMFYILNKYKNAR